MSHRPISPRPVSGVNLIHLDNGREIHLDDIATAAEAQAILDDVDGSILRIEDALAYQHTNVRADWRRRAEGALKRRRRQRPSLQRKLSELRRAEQPGSAGPEGCDARRKAFINAAEELLPIETFTEIWARAAEHDPMAFSTRGEPA